MHNAFTQLTKGAFHLAQQILGHTEDAADVVHDAVQIALSHQSAPTLENELKPWFYKVVRNKAIDKYRGRRFESVDADVHLSQSSSVDGDPEQALERCQRDAHLRHALEQLSFEHREIILLRDYHGLSYAEIAEVTGLKSGSVMSRLHRARTALRSAFQLRYPTADEHFDRSKADE